MAGLPAGGRLRLHGLARGAGQRVLPRGRALGRTPLDQINRMHCQVARQLLVETDRPMDEVARGSGFSGPERMAKVFRRVVGSSPIAFRRLHRA
ncbi:MAG TPA: helix-turn-helix domain-containing protein [Tepidisphaeraceae bacterium]|nr:helix-turn-helix domain-containing protein [Tepidisphaeraceae bacterium]